MKFCKHCGSEVAPSAKFCNSCGQALSSGQASGQQKIEEVKKQVEEDVTSQETDVIKPIGDDPKVDSQLDEQAVPKADQPRKETVELENVDVSHEKSPESDDISTPIQATSTTKQASKNEQFTGLKSPNKPKKTNKKRKFLLLSSIAIIILLIAAYMVGDNITSPKHILKEFEDALEEKDAGKLADLVTSSNKKLEVDEESMKAFIQLYESDANLGHIIGHLRSQADGTTTLTNISPIDLQKDGKRFIIFDNYKLVMHPVMIQIGTNYKGTDILVNGKKITTTKVDYTNEEIGPFLPGEYTVKAVFDTGFFHLDNEQKVKAMDSNFPPYVDLSLEGQNVSFDLYSNKYDELSSVKLFVNGKETGWDLKKEYRVGPLLTDGTMNASFEAEFPWGTLRTNEIPIDTSYIEFNFGNSDEFRQSIMDLIVTFNEEFIEAFTTADPEIISTATDALQEAISKELIAAIYEGVEYKGAFHGIDFYLDSFILKHHYNGYWEVAVDTITYFEEAFYETGGDKAKLEQVGEEMRYELAFDPQLKDWVVTSIDYAGSMDEDRLERFKVDEPVVHTSNWASMVEEAMAELEDEE